MFSISTQLAQYSPQISDKRIIFRKNGLCLYKVAKNIRQCWPFSNKISVKIEASAQKQMQMSSVIILVSICFTRPKEIARKNCTCLIVTILWCFISRRAKCKRWLDCISAIARGQSLRKKGERRLRWVTERIRGQMIIFQIVFRWFNRWSKVAKFLIYLISIFNLL